MKEYIYIEKFKPLEELAVNLEEGRVYAAITDPKIKDQKIVVDRYGNQIWMAPGEYKAAHLQSLSHILNKDNYTSFPLHEEDKKVLDIVFKIQDEVKKIKAKDNKLDKNLKKIESNDKSIYDTISLVVEHIAETYEDKYEYEDFPAVDITGLMRVSQHGKGFNIGSALKYLKRYMTSGFDKSSNTEDLKKAIHYLLYEINRNN